MTQVAKVSEAVSDSQAARALDSAAQAIAKTPSTVQDAVQTAASEARAPTPDVPSATAVQSWGQKAAMDAKSGTTAAAVVTAGPARGASAKPPPPPIATKPKKQSGGFLCGCFGG